MQRPRVAVPIAVTPPPTERWTSLHSHAVGGRRRAAMIYVVGSGPAGVSVASALLDAGTRVTMLDAGLTLEPDRRAVQRRLHHATRDEWSAHDLASIREGMTPTSSGVPLKYVYGSDFPYREASRVAPIVSEGVDTATSLAAGGFSNVWGSAILPYRDEDIDTWPIRAADLAPHYRAVLGFMPVSATDDDLGARFPLFTDRPSALAPSGQARALLADLERRRDALEASGIRFGRSRIAVGGHGRIEATCRYCALCMYGCPDELIYHAGVTLAKLREHPRFTYVSNVVVERVTEHPTGVVITGRSLDGTGTYQATGDRVYLACGAVATSRILMASLDMYDTPVRLLDSQYFVIPLLRYRGEPNVREAPAHTLAQVFVEIDDARVSRRSVHLQLYTYNDLYDATFRAMLGPLHRLLRAPVAQMVSRMLVVQGYLHSDESRAIEMTLAPATGGAPGALRLVAREPERSARERVRRVARTLAAQHAAFQALPITLMVKVARPGRGFHSGGSFPMTAGVPAGAQSDVVGRPGGLQRVHAVDASVFPSIPATTITFSVMANAHRIGALVHDL